MTTDNKHTTYKYELKCTEEGTFYLYPEIYKYGQIERIYLFYTIYFPVSVMEHLLYVQWNLRIDISYNIR
jgi:hypothetical protein